MTPMYKKVKNKLSEIWTFTHVIVLTLGGKNRIFAKNNCHLLNSNQSSNVIYCHKYKVNFNSTKIKNLVPFIGISTNWFRYVFLWITHLENQQLPNIWIRSNPSIHFQNFRLIIRIKENLRNSYNIKYSSQEMHSLFCQKWTSQEFIFIYLSFDLKFIHRWQYEHKKFKSKFCFIIA